ncbi:unnamed protein product, partial [Adineta ricciae]
MQQQQYLHRTDIDIPVVNYRDKVSSSVKDDDVRIVKVHELKQAFDDFIQVSKFSPRDLKEILDLLSQIDDKQLLIDAQLIDHKVYSIFIFILKDLLNKWHVANSFTQFESSYLFPSLIKLICKMNYYSIDLVESLRQCLNDIAKHERYLENINGIEYFSSIVKLYVQDEQIMNVIVNCLCSDHYLNMFQRTGKLEKCLLLTYPRYFLDYQDPQKKDMAEKLLNTLGKSAAQLLARYSKIIDEPVIDLLHILNHSFQLCTTAKVLDTHRLLPLIDELLVILDEKAPSWKENSSISKSSLDLLQTLTDKNEAIRKYVQQREDVFQKLKELNRSSSANVLSDTETSFCYRRDEENDVHELFTSNKNQNKEEITLIWCDQNIDVHDDTNGTAELLQQVNGCVYTYSDPDTCLDNINQIQTEKIFLILSGKTADDMIDKVYHLKQVDSIYIFCMNSVKYEHYLNEPDNKYYKIVGIYTEHEPLLRAVQKNICDVIKQSEVASLLKQYERSTRGLSSESHGFDVFRAFKYVLFRTDYDRECAKREMIEFCRNYYRGNSSSLKDINKFEQTYDSSDAIYWYTRSIFPFKLINKALKTEDYELLLSLRFYIIDLCNNLQLKYDELKQSLSTIVTYRGVRLAPPDIYNLKHNVGKTIATNGFLSTSRSQHVAEVFVGLGQPIEQGLERVILEIHVDTTKSTTALADIARYSEFPEEEEVLFDLGAAFVIDSVTYKKSTHANSNDDIWYVKLSAESEELLMNNIQTLLKKCGETEMNLLVSELLLKMEFYDTCRNYLTSLFDFYGNGHEKVAKIEEFIAWTFEDEKIWDQAIQHYTKAFDLYASSNRWENASRVIIWAANCYYQKQDKIIMRQYAEKANDILKNKTNLSDHHCQFGDVISLYGILEDIDEAARNHFVKALDIYQNALTVCKCNDHDEKIAQTFENIGIRYKDEGDYVKAREYFQKSEKIRCRNITFSKERRAYVTCLQSIGGFYNLVQDRTNGITYMTKAFEFIDVDLIKSVYKENSEVQESVIQIKLFKNIYDTTLLHELKRLELLKKLQPPNYEKIIERHFSIGEIYCKTKDYTWAREHYNEAYNLCDTKISSKDQQAQCLFDMGHRLILADIDSALEFVSKALEIRLLVLKSDDVNIAFSHYDMYVLYEHVEKFDTAIEHLQKAMDIFEKHINNEQNYQFNVKEQYIMCYYFSASMYKEKQEFNKSTEYLLTAVTIIERVFSDIPDNYCTLAKCYLMIAQNYSELRDYNASITFYEKYLETIEKHPEIDTLLQHAHDHASEISNVFRLLGSIYYVKMDYDQSIFYYEKFIKSVSVDQKLLESSFMILGECYSNKKCYEKAIENYDKAAVHYESQLPSEVDYYAACMMYMTGCYLQLGKSQQAPAGSSPPDSGRNCTGNIRSVSDRFQLEVCRKRSGNDWNLRLNFRRQGNVLNYVTIVSNYIQSIPAGSNQFQFQTIPFDSDSRIGIGIGACPMVQELKRLTLNLELQRYEEDIHRYEQLYQEEFNKLQQQTHNPTSTDYKHQIDILVYSVGSYLNNYKHRLLRQIRHREACFHTNLIRQRRRRQSLMTDNNIQVHPQIIVDAPKVALNDAQLQFPS